MLKRILGILGIWILFFSYLTFPSSPSFIALLGEVAIAIIFWFLILKEIKSTKVLKNHLIFNRQQKITISLIFLLLILIMLAGNVPQNISQLANEPLKKFLVGLITAVMAGFFEEAFFRGYLFSSFINCLQQGSFRLVLAGIISGLLFGLAHLINYFMGGANLQSTLQQVFYAVSFGLCLAAIRTAFNGLIIPIIIHILIDLQPAITTYSNYHDPWLPIILAFAPLLLISGLFLFEIGHKVTDKDYIRIK
ncbi:CPBP family intramembrane glutamic endopeptidase [Liquorilactobacillus sicerae]|uniref:CPBP family intramembrane glutamic endopeptidase n=1 Tax=Liquorilactobacillus sicerae TaxID=1416943 RepID=UPI00247FB06D|nr:CPBP family intramembrane glutamic endopeptidase [Liquorilactobacillus sicerae]